jgi:hypothetical protein
MDQFVHRENLARFRRRLAEPGLTEDQRKVLLTLLKEAQVEGRQRTPATEVTSAVAPRLGDGARPHRFIRAEAEGVFPEVGQPQEMSERAAAQRSEHREMARHMSREAGRPAAVVLESGHACAREIVKARLLLIADLEQRRRLSLAAKLHPDCACAGVRFATEASRFADNGSGEGT